MTVQEKLNVIKTSLSDIKTSIINKGVTPVGDITTYSEAIDNISSGTPINNQELTVTENGTYTPDEGYTGFGEVQVNTIQLSPNLGVKVSDGTLLRVTTFTLPKEIHTIGEKGLRYAGYLNYDITKVDLSNIKVIKNGGMYSTFGSSTYITSVDLSSLITIHESALNSTFSGCKNLTTVNLSNLTEITGTGAMYSTFKNTKLTSLSFPKLAKIISLTSTTNIMNDMLSGVTGCTVHFPSNLSSTIGNLDACKKGFSGTKTTVLFDLPATA